MNLHGSRRWIPLLAGIVLAFLPARGADPPGDGSPFPAWGGLRVGEEARSAAGAVIRKGRIRAEFLSGTFARVENLAGEFAGWLFHGEGRWSYRVEDSQDRFSLPGTLRQLAPGATLDRWTLRDRFRDCLLLFARPPEGTLRRPGGNAVPPPGDSGERLARLSGLPRDGSFLRLQHRAPAARIDGRDQWILAVFQGGRYTWGWEWNRSDRWYEGMWVRRSGVPENIPRWDRLSLQALPGTDGRTPPRYTVRKVEIEAESPDNHRFRAATDLEVEAIGQGLRILELSLMSRGGRNGEEPYRVRRVVDGRGNELPWFHSYDRISIDLGRRHGPGETIRLRVEADGDVFTDRAGSLADNYRAFWGRAWFPRGRSSGENRFTFRLRVRTRHPFVPVASGDTVSRRRDGEMNELVSESRVPAWLVALFAGKYVPVEVREGDFVVRAWRYAGGRTVDAERLARVALMFVRIYEGMFGRLPWRELDLVESPDYGLYGMSPRGLILTSSTIFRSRRPEDRTTRSRGSNLMLAHEVAHQWFGHLAWQRDWFRDNWLTESLAEYAAGLGMEVAVRAAEKAGRKPRGAVVRFRDRVAEWRSEADTVEGKGTVLGANLLGGDRSRGYRIALLYDRGPLVLHGFRTLVGEDGFLRTMREYLAAADIGPVETRDLVAAARRATGRDWGWYFREWLEKPWIPVVEVTWRRAPGDQGKVVVSGTLRQDPGRFMKVFVPFVATMPGGERVVRLVFQERPDQEYRFELPREPRKLEVDPGRNRLVQWKVRRE